MPRVLSDMDRDWQADQALERDLRDMASKLETIAARPRIAGTKRARDSRELAEALREEADHIVLVWNLDGRRPS